MNNTSGDSGDENPVDPRMARRRQDAIGNKLRQMYDEVVGEDIPDEFLSFLKQAQDREPEGAGTDRKTPPDGGKSGKSSTS